MGMSELPMGLKLTENNIIEIEYIINDLLKKCELDNRKGYLTIYLNGNMLSYRCKNIRIFEINKYIKIEINDDKRNGIWIDKKQFAFEIDFVKGWSYVDGYEFEILLRKR